MSLDSASVLAACPHCKAPAGTACFRGYADGSAITVATHVERTRAAA